MRRLSEVPVIKKTEKKQGCNIINTQNNGYRRLDFSNIKFSDTVADINDVLQDIPSVELSSKVKFTKAEKDYKNKCVKLVIDDTGGRVDGVYDYTFICFLKFIAQTISYLIN